MAKPFLCVDFDGVVHSYISGWQGAEVVSDPPVAGAFAWLVAMAEVFQVCIYSSRSKEPGGVIAMANWIAKWDTEGEVLPIVSFPVQKPAAFLTIDDRAICFNGKFDDLTTERLLAFKPWNHRP
jgi:hypothetical protein